MNIMESIIASTDTTPFIGELVLGLKGAPQYVNSSNNAAVHCHTPGVVQNGTNVLGINISDATQWRTLSAIHLRFKSIFLAPSKFARDNKGKTIVLRTCCVLLLQAVHELRHVLLIQRLNF